MAHHTHQTVTRHQITTALSVITNPAHFCENPKHYQTAWQTLKEARGESVDFRHIGPASHRIDEGGDTPTGIAGMTRGCLARLRAHAASKNIPLVSTSWPQGGDAA